MKIKNRRFIILVLLSAIAILSELFARFYLGLGNPPLSISDGEIDYIFAPNQVCNRFGRRILYNNLSMRCDFAISESFCQRIFVVGDSVINGGVLTDHRSLATTILQERLDRSRTKLQICNVSAGSWGPGNYAAYFRKHQRIVGTNDVLIVEVNSHDLWEDDPSETGGRNVGKDVALPAHKPWCALWDGFDRYLLPRVRKWLGMATVNTKVDVPKWGEDVAGSAAKYNLSMLDEVYALPFAKKYILIHRSRREMLDDKVTPGENAFREWASERDVPVIELNLKSGDYRDVIHLSESGQRKMADVIEDAIK